MLKIQRSTNPRVVLALSGRIEMEDLSELQRVFALENGAQHLVLDLKDVTLVHRDAVKFLADCRAKGMALENCPAYIRQWMAREAG
jgi:hypothetical protein